MLSDERARFYIILSEKPFLHNHCGLRSRFYSGTHFYKLSAMHTTPHTALLPLFFKTGIQQEQSKSVPSISFPKTDQNMIEAGFFQARPDADKHVTQKREN
jgi:hypothetical protein